MGIKRKRPAPGGTGHDDADVRASDLEGDARQRAGQAGHASEQLRSVRVTGRRTDRATSSRLAIAGRRDQNCHGALGFAEGCPRATDLAIVDAQVGRIEADHARLRIGRRCHVGRRIEHALLLEHRGRAVAARTGRAVRSHLHLVGSRCGEQGGCRRARVLVG